MGLFPSLPGSANGVYGQSSLKRARSSDGNITASAAAAATAAAAAVLHGVAASMEGCHTGNSGDEGSSDNIAARFRGPDGGAGCDFGNDNDAMSGDSLRVVRQKRE